MKPKKRPRNAVSFTKFRTFQGTALRYLINRYSLIDSVPLDLRLKAYAILSALDSSRFGDAVFLSGEVQSQMYLDAEAHRLGYQIAALVKKVPFKDSELDPEGKARDAFRAAEEHCRATNEVLRPLCAFLSGKPGYVLDDSSKRVVQLVSRAKKYVRRVLGNSPDLDAMYSLARFSSGSANGASGKATHYLRKMGCTYWSVTPTALPHVIAAARRIPAFHEALVGFDYENLIGFPWMTGEEFFSREFRKRCKYVEHDTITYVPKNADIHRTVGTPPLLNIFLQNGVGDWIRSRLRDRAGIDITTAQEAVNGKLAYLGSSCEGMPFSTIDLKAASDTISIAFVKLLLPAEWFEFLDQIRSPAFKLDFEPVERSEKFMAMGNGFCFPLETLLFWSLVQAVYEDNDIPDGRCAVYGDDIIVYQSAALELIELLDACGFDVNISKTFVFGPFRESCGQDFFNGVNVRPFVCDFTIADWGQAFHFINSLRHRGYSTLATDLVDLIPEPWRLYRPSLCSGPSNSAIECDYTTFLGKPGSTWNRDLQCWEWDELIASPVMDDERYGSFRRYEMGAALQGATPDQAGSPSFALRRETRTYVRRVAHG